MYNPSLRTLFPLLALLLLLVGGCQTLESKRSNIELENVLNSYHTTIRWDRPEKAYLFLKPAHFAGERLPAGLDNVRVTGYEVIQPPAPVSDGVVAQTVRISYVLEDRQIERNLLDQQLWEYQTESRIWYRINPIPAYQ
ncbi:MAG: hypothetical protein KDI27_00350 [Gammaproteobacteria bacterium]|nr:hypothetical protein [Gammaproteobacteria bacterium]MCB1849680.1 hypothetical protein [Gammaproteobacteria bacterium]MCP5418547.1 hypothetical protein [Chromatiaceae bacterium]